MFYKLNDEKNVMECPLEEYVESIKDKGHVTRVAQDTGEDYFLSTVFLGVDMSFNQERPTCFETCLFLKEDNDVLQRYATWKEAEFMHEFYKGIIQGLKEKGLLNFNTVYMTLELMRGEHGGD